MSTVDDLPLSGLLPTKAGVAHVATVSLVVFAAFIATGLLNGSPWNPEFAVPTTAILTHDVARMLGGAENYAMMFAPLALMLVLDLRPLKRFVASILVSMPIAGFFSAMSDLSYAIEASHQPHPRYPDPELSFYATEAWDGFMHGAFGGVFLGGFLIALPFFLLVVVSDRYAGTTLLGGQGDR